MTSILSRFFFFLKDPAPTEISPLPLHDPLPICQPSLRFSFSHALVREALYEELGVTQRVRLHRRIAEVIEEICGDDREPHLEELAHHFLERSEEHTSELQSPCNLVCRLLLEKKK